MWFAKWSSVGGLGNCNDNDGDVETLERSRLESGVYDVTCNETAA